jgi:hypothetical protein
MAPSQFLLDHIDDALEQLILERLAQDWTRRPMSMFAQDQWTVTLVHSRTFQMPTHASQQMAPLFKRQRNALRLQHLEQAVRPDLRRCAALTTIAHRERPMPMHILDLPRRQLSTDVDAFHVRDLLAHCVDPLYDGLGIDLDFD